MRYIGYDAKSIKRVYGEAEQADIAYRECLVAIKEYVKNRPDTGPISEWSIEKGND